MLAKGPRLSLHDITKKFGDFTAVEKVTIELFRGEIHAIVGENGAGKSTLMRVLAGHMAATGGSMILDEAPVAIDRAAPGQRPAVGFLEQEGGLIAELSGAERVTSRGSERDLVEIGPQRATVSKRSPSNLAALSIPTFRFCL